MDIEDIGTVLGVFAAGLIGLAMIAVLIAFPTMWLWNWLMPVIFGLPEVNVLQAFGLLLLSGILFKSNTTVNKN